MVRWNRFSLLSLCQSEVPFQFNANVSNTLGKSIQFRCPNQFGSQFQTEPSSVQIESPLWESIEIRISWFGCVQFNLPNSIDLSICWIDPRVQINPNRSEYWMFYGLIAHHFFLLFLFCPIYFECSLNFILFLKKKEKRNELYSKYIRKMNMLPIIRCNFHILVSVWPLFLIRTSTIMLLWLALNHYWYTGSLWFTTDQS